jgi:hypothetical protein
MRGWYELLVLQQDPSTLVKPYAILKSWRATLQTLSTFAVQLVTLVISLGLLIGLSFLATYGKTSAWANSLIGMLSAIGVTAAAVQAKMKNTAQAAIPRLHQDVYADLVAADITHVPRKPGVSERKMRKLVVASAQNRELTTIASA